MKIDRRSFLSFIVGGAAGTALTPLPWKMMDDSAIWSQNWPWTPVPPNGEVTFVNSVCRLCPGGCGITVRKVEDRAVKIEGMEGYPVNDGGICPLGLSGLQLLYGPTRIPLPLKRKGSRGEGKWEKISWEKAISEVVTKLGEIRKNNRSHGLACISGTDRGTVARLMTRFMSAFGSQNFIRMPSMEDSYELVLYLMHGVRAKAGFDIENATFVLSFGSGVIEGWGSPVRMFRANSKLKRTGGKVVQIEARLSKSAAKSDKWIPINPGSETALALAMAHVIIKEELYNKNFIGSHAFGFEDWTDGKGNKQKGFKSLVTDDYSPENVAEATGIEKAVIVSLARHFARASKPLAICGRGQGNTSSAIGEFLAVQTLNALMGNVNQKGGFLAISDNDYIDWPEIETDRIASNGLQNGRLDEAGSEKFPSVRYLSHRFFENINAETGYPIQALFAAGANPLYSLPDAKAVKAALDKVPFIVSFSSYMDETAQYSDIILPNHTYLERYEDVPPPIGLHKPVIGLTRPVVSPQLNTKHLGDVILSIAKGLGGSVAQAFPWKSYEACLEKTLGRKLDTLLDKGYWSPTVFSVPEWKKAFETASGKFEFVVSDQNGNGDRKSKPITDWYTGVEPQGDANTYPLLLIPYDSMRLVNRFIGDPPFVIKTVEDTVLKGKNVFIEINPKTAKQLGLSEGKTARLTTPKGNAKVRVHLFEGIKEGIIALPKGLGHTAYDNYIAQKGVNYNELIGAVYDPASGLDAAWGIRAKLSKA
jgi:anaerobic selenocysteine-containing dehydrogenase